MAKTKIVLKNAYIWLSEDKEVLQDKAVSTAKNPKYNGYEIGLTSMVYNILIKGLLVVLLNGTLCQTNS